MPDRGSVVMEVMAVDQERNFRRGQREGDGPGYRAVSWVWGVDKVNANGGISLDPLATGGYLLHLGQSCVLQRRCA
jgi:hypothetical protein